MKSASAEGAESRNLGHAFFTIPVDERGALLTPLVEEEPLDVVAALARLGALQAVFPDGKI